MATIPRRALRRPPLLKGGYPLVRYAPKFDGLTQYATMSANFSGNHWFEVDFKVPPSPVTANSAIVGSSNGQLTLYLDSSYRLSLQLPTSSGLRYDISHIITDKAGDFITVRLSVTSGVVEMKVNGVSVDSYDYSSIGLVDVQIGYLARWNDIFYPDIIKGYRDSAGNVFNLNDKDRDPVMLNSGSGANGTYINSTSAMWVEI